MINALETGCCHWRLQSEQRLSRINNDYSPFPHRKDYFSTKEGDNRPAFTHNIHIAFFTQVSSNSTRPSSELNRLHLKQHPPMFSSAYRNAFSADRQTLLEDYKTGISETAREKKTERQLCKLAVTSQQDVRVDDEELI